VDISLGDARILAPGPWLGRDGSIARKLARVALDRVD